MNPVTFVKIGSSYVLFGKPHDLHYSEWEINGNTVIARDFPFVIPEEIKTFQYVKQTRDESLDIFTRDGETIDKEVYLKELQELRAKAKNTYEEDEDLEWAELEDQVRFLRFKQGVRINTGFRKEKIDIKFVIIDDNIESLPPFTSPVRLAYHAGNDLKAFNYQVSLTKLLPLAIALGEFEDCDVKPDPSPHMASRYLQINGKSAEVPNEYAPTSCVGTREQCQRRHEANLEKLVEFIGTRLRTTLNKPLPPTSGEIAAALNRVLKQADEVRSAQMANKRPNYTTFVAELCTDLKRIIGKFPTS